TLRTPTTTRGDPMPVRRFLPVALGAFLTACSSTPLIDVPPSPTPEPTPVLESGDFDPEGDFEVFDPCTEIPPEVLAEAGLGEPVREPYYDGNMSVLCSFVPSNIQIPGVFSLVGDRNTRTKLEEWGLILDGSPRTDLQGTYLHAM